MFKGCWGLVVGAVLVVGCRDHAPRSKEERAKDALSRVAQIEPGLAKVRGLAFDRQVPAAYQAVADFRSFVRRGLAKAAKHDRDESDALVALGLLPPATDVARAVEDAYATQAAAYYDPEAKQFYLVMVPQDDMTLDMVSAHELTHALQDQHFGLTAYLHGAGDNSDAAIARKFVVEGDAMLSAILYLVAQKTQRPDVTPEQIKAMRTQLERLASLDPKAMAATLKQQVSSAKLDPEIAKSLDAIDSIPPAILVPLVDSYMKGALLALDAYSERGWARVDELYKDPPESTEQVLHPDTRLLGKRDHAHKVTLPTFEGYEAIASNVIGELEWGVYFSVWAHDGDGHEEVNWGGDRYTVLRREDGKLVAVIATIWDSEYDAKLFYDAYVSTLKTRHGGKLQVQRDKDQTLLDYGDESSWVLLDGRKVFAVDGGDDEAIVNRLIDDTTFDGSDGR